MQFEPRFVEFADFAVDRFVTRDQPRVAEVLRGGGFIERVFLLAPDRFGLEREPQLKAARAAVLAETPERLEWRGSERELEREIKLAKITLERRIPVNPRITPLLHWCTPSLYIGVPCRIPGADDEVSVRVWLPHARDSACACGVRIRPEVSGITRYIGRWMYAAQHVGAEPTVWRCELPSFCETSLPIALEIAPNPQGFMQAMFIAHHGAAAIVVGTASGAGRTNPNLDELPPVTRLLPSGWNYLKPDRTQGSGEPCFPNGAARPSDGVFVPSEELFLACARETWAVSLDDAMRVAAAGRGLPTG
jgi:hypothetical protein